ncbi:MAG TPA: hypothetical protein PLN94_19520, partial [Thiolinea sp.]|nr:hypothetical protein [Thiolinea sp.]
MRQWFDEHRAELEHWLHVIHQHPETGFDENHTADFVAERLRAAGIEVTTGIGRTGVVGVLQGTGGTGRRIGFRAELDALPMQEHAGIHYHSRI